MKNLNSLLARLSTISLAAAMFFSAAQAATTARKDPRAAAAVIEALVHQAASQDAQKQEVAKALTSDSGPSSLYDIHNKNLVVGSLTAPRKAVVFGEIRSAGDLVAGRIDATSRDADGYKNGTGMKHLIGVAELDPRTQQFAIAFKDKTKACHGAMVSLDFVTTVTSDHLSGVAADNGVVTTGVIVRDVYVHPQMTAQQIMGNRVSGQLRASRQDMRHTTTSWCVNTVNALTEAIDFRLTPTVRVEDLTKDVCFGFVPYSRSYPVTNSGSTGFYEAGWNRTNYSSGYPVWDTGMLSYQVAGKEISAVGVVTETVSDLQPIDVFDLFTDEELAALLESLKEYFAEDSTKIREYLMTHRHQLSRAFKALR